MLVFLTIIFGGGVAVFWAYNFRNDRTLAQMVMKVANKELRGRLHFGSMHWSPRAIFDVMLGIPVAAQVEDFRVYDPNGRQVIGCPRATARLVVGPLMSLTTLHVDRVRADSAWVRVEEVSLPGRAKPEIGLFAAFGSKKPGDPSKRGLGIVFTDFAIKKVRAAFRFEGWSLEVDDLDPVGTIAHHGGNVVEEGLQIEAKVPHGRGRLKIGEVIFPLDHIDVRRFAFPKHDPTNARVDLLANVAGARSKIVGRLLGVFDKTPRVDLELDTRGAGPLRVGLGEMFAGAIEAHIRATGPLVRPRAVGTFSGARLLFGPQPVEEIGGEVRADASKGTIELAGIRGRALGGEVTGDGLLDFGNDQFQATIALGKVDPGRLDPALAGALGGEIKLSGHLFEMARSKTAVDLRYRPSARRGVGAWLPRETRITGTAHVGARIIDLSRVRLAGEGNAISIRGSINLLEARANLRLELELMKLGEALARRGVVAAARSLTGELRLRGRYPRLSADGSVTMRGVGYGALRLPLLKGKVGFSRGTLALSDVRATGLGGRVRGAVKVELFDREITRPRRRPRLDARLELVGTDLASFGLPAQITGRANAKVSVSGSFDSLSGGGTADLVGLRIGSDRYSRARFRFALLPDRVRIEGGELVRAQGGALEAKGEVLFGGGLALSTSARGFPLAAIPPIAQIPLDIGGIISGRVDVSGTLADPRFAGTVAVSKARLRGMDLGSGKVVLQPGSDIVRVNGQLYGGHFKLDGYVMMQPVPRLHMTVDVARFPLHLLLPELRRVGDVRARIAGRIQLDANAEQGLTWANASFPELVLAMHYRPPGVRQGRIVRLHAKDALRARYKDGRLELLSARLASTVSGRGDEGEFSIGGWLTTDKTDLRLRGKVALAVLEFFLAKRVTKISGEARVNVHATGALTNPKLQGSLALSQVQIRLPKFDRAISIPRSRLELTPDKLQIAKLPVIVGGRRMQASGVVDLAALRPKTMRLAISGAFDLHLLELLFPEQITQAAGSAQLRLSVDGPVGDPRVRGRVSIDRVEVTPRALGRTLLLTRGIVAFSSYQIKTLQPLEGLYDEGNLRLDGQLRMDRWEPVDIYVKVNGTGIPFRQPGVYLAEANLGLTLVGDSHQLQLSGQVDLIDARYIREFDIVKNALIRPRSFEEETPIWHGRSALENMELKLLVRSTGPLTVKNRYGELSLDGALVVTGTLSDPRLHGQIRAEEGKFRIPFLHGEYTLDRGLIVFDKKAGADEAQLDISAINRIDRGGEDYLITLGLKGPLRDVRLSLQSEPPLDPGQIATLLATGRTTDELRSELRGDQSTGAGAAGAADAQVKQLTGDLLGGIVEDQIKRVTRLDLFRLELGTETLGLRACKNFGRYLENCFNYERGLAAEEQRAEVTMAGKLHDYLRLIGRAQRLSTRLETEDENNTRVRLELKARFRLR